MMGLTSAGERTRFCTRSAEEIVPVFKLLDGQAFGRRTPPERSLEARGRREPDCPPPLKSSLNRALSDPFRRCGGGLLSC